MENRTTVLPASAVLLLMACAHEPQAYTFSCDRTAAEVNAAATSVLTRNDDAIAVTTPSGVVTRWRETGRETENVDSKTYQPEPVSDRRRIVLAVEPAGTASRVTVRSEYETCPITMPLDVTSDAMEACFRSWYITGKQQDAERKLADQLRSAISSAQ